MTNPIDELIEKIGPSDSFVRRTRNPDLPQPVKFEPTKKKPGDIEISTWRGARG